MPTPLTPISATSSRGPQRDDDHFDDFLSTLRKRFTTLTAKGDPIFTTSASDVPLGLFGAFLHAVPMHRRQHYTCHACRSFLNRFGGLVTIDAIGDVTSLFWDYQDDFPPFFAPAVRALRRIIVQSTITGVFLSEAKTWGTLEDKIKKPPYSWTHMQVSPPPRLIFNGRVKNAEQTMAERREEFAMLSRSVVEFPTSAVNEANALLTSGKLFRAEKVAGPAKWLLELHRQLRGAQPGSLHFTNTVWRAVATAPTGFCHVRSNALGTLLEDLRDRLSFPDIKRRFEEMMDPTQYQRPQSPPKAGNLVVADKVVGKLSSEGALVRRFARLDDLQLLWRARPEAKVPKKGPFAHLHPVAPEPRLLDQAPIMMTWAKFRKEVLPTAEAIEFHVPSKNDSFGALVTAVSPDAPPILQWDREDQRNPVSWYFYSAGSPAARWGLRPNTYHRVSAVTLQPSMWFDEEAFPQHGKKVFFLLDGAKDLQYGGTGFFPEMLKSVYHEVRRTMEAYAQSADVRDANKASACGIGLQSGTPWKHTFRVTRLGMKIAYILDRWD